MKVLGIESTAHTLGVSIIEAKNSSPKCKILSNERRLFTTDTGGMIPSKVADHHIEYANEIIKSSVAKSKVSLNDIDLISYSESPGIGHSLRIGLMMAKTLAVKLNKPIIGVNHCIAHLEIGRVMTDAKDPILLYLSGANTQVIAYDAGKYRIFGETLDIGIGNFLDTFARAMNLGFPGGPKIYELAQKSNNYIELPYSVKGMDVSFGGMLTNLKHKIAEGKYKNEDLCYSAQETAFSMMIEVAERAMAHCDKNELLLGGGVACNKRLQEMANIMCNDRKARCYVLPNELNVDNAAMIAWLGFLMHKGKGRKTEINIDPKKATIRPYVRTDEVEVYWR